MKKENNFIKIVYIRLRDVEIGDVVVSLDNTTTLLVLSIKTTFLHNHIRGFTMIRNDNKQYVVNDYDETQLNQLRKVYRFK